MMMMLQIRHTCARFAGRACADLIEVQLPPAVARDEAAILRAFEETIRAAGRRIRLAVIDHVSSFPPVLFPVQQICALCRQHGIKGRGPCNAELLVVQKPERPGFGNSP